MEIGGFHGKTEIIKYKKPWQLSSILANITQAKSGFLSEMQTSVSAHNTGGLTVGFDVRC